MLCLVCAILTSPFAGAGLGRALQWPFGSAFGCDEGGRIRRQLCHADRTAVRTMLALHIFASGRCDRGCYQCFILGHAGGTW